MSRKVNVKKLTSEELVPKVSQLIHSTIKACFPQIYEPEVIRFFLDYHSEEEIWSKYNKGNFFVATEIDENNVVASGYLLEKEIGGVYVRPAYQRKGYGRKILACLLDLAYSQKIDAVWVDATPLAKGFYLSMGFKLIEKKTDFVGNNVPLDYFRMEKPVYR